MASATSAVSWGKYDTIGKMEEEFKKLKDRLKAAIKAAGGKLFLRVNVPTLHIRASNGKKRLIQGLIRHADGRTERKLHPIELKDVDSEKFSPTLGIDILAYLKIEEDNEDLPDTEHRPHNTVLLNDGTTRVRPFDVGSEAHFARLALREQVAAKPLFGDPISNMSVPGSKITPAVKAEVARQMAIFREQEAIESAGVA